VLAMATLRPQGLLPTDAATGSALWPARRCRRQEMEVPSVVFAQAAPRHSSWCGWCSWGHMASL